MNNTALSEQQKSEVDIIAPVSPVTPARNVAVDAYRGFVMVLMMAEVMNLARVAALHPGNYSGSSWATTKRMSSGQDARSTT